MPSGKRGASGGYLHNVLADGARPFPYRGNVRALLGVPEGEGSRPAFSPTLPPVGFKYTDRETGFFPRFRSSDARLLEGFPEHEGVSYLAKNLASDLPSADAPDGGPWAEPDVFLDAVREDGQPDVGHASSVTFDRSAGEDARPDTAMSPTPFAAQREDGTSPSADRSSPSTHEPHVERPESVPMPSERTHVEIPGVSGENLSFPALPSTEQDDDGHTQGNGSGVGSQDSLDAARKDARSDAAIKPVGVNGPESKSLGPTVETAPDGTLSRRATAHVVASGGVHAGECPAESPPQAIPVAEGHSPSSYAASPKQARVEIPDVSEKRVPFPTLLSAEQGDDARTQESGPGNGLQNTYTRTTRQPAGGKPPAARSRADTVSQPSADAVARIEHLRHAVHQLAAKVSSLAREDDEPQSRQPEQVPPPPVQPIVVVNRPLVQRRAPCAFWERSYLSRSLLRTLR